MISTVTSAPCAAAIPSATRRMPSCTCVRVDSLTVRIVPSISAVSGMMLFVVPALMRPTVTTDGSNTSMLRVTIIWIACTISQAIGIGSRARNGSLACPPRPTTSMMNRSADAMIGPPRELDPPGGQRRRDVQRERPGHRRRRAVGEGRNVEQSLVEHEAGAVVALLARLEHEQHPTGDVVAACRQQLGRAGEHRDVGVVPAGVHRAVGARGEVEPGVLVQRQRVHVAAQQHRRAGLAAGEHRGDAARGLVQLDVERQAVDRLEHVLPGHGQLVADLRPLVELAAQRTVSSWRSWASSRSVSTVMAAW